MSTEAIIAANQEWIDAVWSRLIQKMPYALDCAKGLDFIPYTSRNGQWHPGPVDGISWWTNGFWPAILWQMYIHTGDARYKAEAEHAETMLDEAFREYDHLHHDVGFMWLISSGVNFRLTKNEASRKRTLLAANLLAGRFNPVGFLRAWNEDRVGWAIIDCMLNINLLYWASDDTGDPRYRKIAMAHADTTLKHFVRADGSVNHIVIFDPETMEVLDKPAGQGYAPGSSWSRGQTWALYGFVLSYLHTGKPEYLDIAQRVAHYFLANIQDDWLPRCDFRQPKEPELYDICASGIAACALIELSNIVPPEEGDPYLHAGIQLLKAAEAFCADWSLTEPAILQKCTGAYHNERDHHISMIYADYSRLA